MGRKDQPGSGGSSSTPKPPLKRLAVAASIPLRWRRPEDRLIVIPNSALMDLGCPPEIRHDLVGHRKSKRDAAYERPSPLEDQRRWIEKIDGILLAP